MWLAGSILLLIILFALLIQLPFFQNFIIQKTVTIISNKTGTHLQIERIGITFPKSVFIDGLYIEDLSKDTLLYAGEIKLNLDMIALFSGNVRVGSASVENMTGNIYRAENDSSFNFDFLITTFNNQDSKKEVQTHTESKELSIDEIRLSGIKLLFDDKYSGLYSQIKLGRLELKMNELDPGNSKYNIKNLLIDGLQGEVVINKKSKEVSEGSASPPWILAENLEIENSLFKMSDHVSSNNISLQIHQLALKNADINLKTETALLDKFSLRESTIKIELTQNEKSDTGLVKQQNIKSNWKASLKELDLTGNQIAYNIVNKPVIKNSFDISHLNYKNVNAHAEKIYYSSIETRASVKNISARDANGLAVKSFSTDFLMNDTSLSAIDLKLKTLNSEIKTSVGLTYSSLSSLKDSIGNLYVKAYVKPSSFSAKDILFFSPELTTRPFFNNENNVCTIEGRVTGKINQLSGESISIRTGNKTSLKTDFKITGLPEFNKAYFDFPNIKIITGRNDVANFAGKNALPQNISIPENIHLSAKFKGRIKTFESFIGLTTDYGDLSAFVVVSDQEKFTGNIHVTNFNAGLLLKNDSLFGPVTLKASVDGKGLDTKTMTAFVRINVPSFYLNNYTYQNLTIAGDITDRQFEGKVSLNDSNAIIDFDGLVNIAEGKEHYKFSLDVKAADLKNIGISKEDLRVSAKAVADLKGKDMNTISGNAGITQVVIAKHGEKYQLDSVVYASINEKRKSIMSLNSALVGIKYNGTFAPGNIGFAFKRQVNKFFQLFTEEESRYADSESQNFTFEVQLHNHPFLSEVFLPGLTEFEPGTITGSFDSEKDQLIVNADVKKLVYSGTEIRNLSFAINSDKEKFDYSLTTKNISTAEFNLENFIASGSLKGQKAFLNISSVNENEVKKLVVKVTVQNAENGYRISLNPDEFYLGGAQWILPGDNYLAFSNAGFLIHNISLTKSQAQISIASVNNQYNDDIKINIKNFDLVDISQIIKKDTAIIGGMLNADLLLKKVNSSYGLIANASIADLTIKKVKIGTLTLKADNPSTEKFTIDAKLKGEGNDISINGYFIPKEISNGLNIHAAINNLSVKTAEAFSMGQISEGSGSISGNFSIEGNSKDPRVNGSLFFNDAYFKPAVLNNKLHFKNEKVEIKPSGIYFDNFTFTDEENHSAQVNGAITMKQFSDIAFALTVDADDFLLFNTSEKDNKLYYGRMIVDSHINLKGTLDFPSVNAKIKLKEGSNFTFAVPEDKLTTDRGENVVLFTDTLNLHPILTRNEEAEKQKSELRGYDVNADIEIDNKATLRLLLDPSAKDSLVVRGDAALNFSLDPSGKISLTGGYNLTEGSYLVSIQSLIKKRFNIESGSTITWNGDPLDADLNINAIYTIRTSALELMADQVSGVTDVVRNSYRERLTFLLYLKLRGALLKPEITFEIQQPPEEKGALGGTVNAKLNQLNEDPSALNKQVFSLLVLGRFIQENPLESSGGSAISSVARGSVGSFLSARLNQLGAHVLPGVELNFDVQSYDDYTSGQAEGRTQVGIGLRKELFSQRLSVQVGGTVDVEGEKARSNNASDITGNVILEYKITEDGRYRLKGFRENVYDDPIEGELIETGGGILYTRDFDKWKEFFSSPGKKVKDKNDPPAKQ